MKKFPPVLFLAAVSSLLGQTVSFAPAPNGITPTVIVSPQPHGAAWTASDGLGNTIGGQYYDQRSGAAITVNPIPLRQPVTAPAPAPAYPASSMTDYSIPSVMPVMIPVLAPAPAPAIKLPPDYRQLPESYYRWCERNLGIRKGDMIRPETRKKLIELWEKGRDI